MSPRLFVDMDGTLTEFKVLNTLEPLFEKGYFLNLKAVPSVVQAVKKIIAEGEIKVYSLSAVLKDNPFAQREKHEWLDRFLPELSEENRLFCLCGENKKDFVDEILGIQEDDYLLDDYSKNLFLWGDKGIKILNGINHTKGSWPGNRLRNNKDGELLAEQMKEIIFRGRVIQEENFRKEEDILKQWQEFEWQRSKAMLKAGFSWEKIQPFSKLRIEAGQILKKEIEKETLTREESEWEIEL